MALTLEEAVEELDSRLNTLSLQVQNCPGPILHEIMLKFMALAPGAGVVLPHPGNYGIETFRSHVQQIRDHLLALGDPDLISKASVCVFIVGNLYE
ncbi:hypothetical protein niasHT_005727 [Heterodera trifolii]|uniref:Uncharacterized protein n=1 Tax=Heterodera trifolii TaxID=157864 RepID=A0ABD2LYU8_9BILA